jgi:hypothetical protein
MKLAFELEVPDGAIDETLAAELRRSILMDEQRGGRCARGLGLTVIRTPLIYADAKSLGLVDSVREKLEELRARGFDSVLATRKRSFGSSASGDLGPCHLETRVAPSSRPRQSKRRLAGSPGHLRKRPPT